MQPSQKLTQTFRALVALVEDEAAHNPVFAQRLEEIVAELPVGSLGKKPASSRRTNKNVDVPDVLKVFQEKGDFEFRLWLRDFNVTTLKAIVKANGFDPGKISQRWIDPDKFITLIAEQTAARLRRGSAFLPQKSTEKPPDPF